MWSKVSALLEKRQITIYRLCEDLKMPKTTFYRWQKSGHTNNLSVLSKVADYFGVSITDLM